MNMNRKTMKTESALVKAAYCPLAYATVFKKGWERVVKASQTSLKAVEENAEVLASYREALPVQNPFLFDLAGRALRGYVTFQKSLLDLAVEQSTAGLGVQATEEVSHQVDRMKAAPRPSRSPTDAAPTSGVERTAKHTKAESDAVKQQPGIATAPVQMNIDKDPDSIELRMLAKEIVDLVIMPAAKPTIQ